MLRFWIILDARVIHYLCCNTKIVNSYTHFLFKTILLRYDLDSVLTAFAFPVKTKISQS